MTKNTPREPLSRSILHFPPLQCYSFVSASVAKGKFDDYFIRV